MTPSTLARGVWGVVSTPFDQDMAVDVAGLTRLARHYEAIGATGLTVLGVFGEAASLSSRERAVVIETVRDSVTLPLVIGFSSLATAPVVDDVGAAKALLGDRLAGAMLHINSPNPTVFSAHFRAVAAETGVGVVAQNYPVASGVNVDLGAQLAGLAAVPELVAIKEEAAPTPVRIAALVKAFDVPRFAVPVFGGLGGLNLLDELAVGSAGAMTGFSYPEALVETVRAFDAGGIAAARKVFTPYLPLVNFEQQAGIALAIRKTCQQRRGLIDHAAVRGPARSLPDELVPLLDAHLAAIEASA